MSSAGGTSFSTVSGYYGRGFPGLRQHSFRRANITGGSKWGAPRGEKLLEQVARDRIGELRASAAALVNAISALLENGESPRPGKQAMNTSKRGPGKKRG